MPTYINQLSINHTTKQSYADNVCEDTFLEMCEVFFVCLCVNYQLSVVVVVYKAQDNIIELKGTVFEWQLLL